MLIKEKFAMSSEANLKIVEEVVDNTKKGKYLIDRVDKEVIAEDDHWGGHDTGERIMTIYYKVNINN